MERDMYLYTDQHSENQSRQSSSTPIPLDHRKEILYLKVCKVTFSYIYTA